MLARRMSPQGCSLARIIGRFGNDQDLPNQLHAVGKQAEWKTLATSLATWKDVVAAVNTVLQGGTHGQAAMA
jgi:hypothetical protein